MSLAAGGRLGAYEILCSLGAGGMGEVYRARDARLGRDVAIKVLPPDVTREAGRLARFDREARAIAALNHPHIVTIYSTEEADGIRFLTMELVEGTTLSDLIAAGTRHACRGDRLRAQDAAAAIALELERRAENEYIGGAAADGVVIAADGPAGRYNPRVAPMRVLTIAVLSLTAALSASNAYPPPRFTDPERVTKLGSAMPEIDRIFRAYAADRKIPGMVWGVVIDGRLAHVASIGVRDRASNAPVSPSTAFRIASMTKSFTALAILKLRDEGALSLDDPVLKWIPEFARMELPTRDSAPLRVRNLLSHSSGFPEDNPWGDQQLNATDAALDAWLKAGIPFSTPPGTRYEYSNYAFALLGRIVGRASRIGYERYMRERILQPLGMSTTAFEYSDVPASSRAIGYRLRPDGTYAEEPPLPHGAFGAMGGILTTAHDMGRYVAFHLSAWPARDDPEAGPVNRASVREMAHLWTPANLNARGSASGVQASISGYGYGLRVTSDCRFETIVGHGGGLPGFGSYMQWLPEYGVGMFAMATLTYVGPSEPMSAAWDVMAKTGGLRAREWVATTRQLEMRDAVAGIWNEWNDRSVADIAAVNFLLDTPAVERQAQVEALKKEVGTCGAAGPLRAENWLRGQFNLQCANGTVGAFFTLAPTQPPMLQHLEFRKLTSNSDRMGAPTGAPAGVSCRP